MAWLRLTPQRQGMPSCLVSTSRRVWDPALCLASLPREPGPAPGKSKASALGGGQAEKAALHAGMPISSANPGARVQTLCVPQGLPCDDGQVVLHFLGLSFLN